MLLHALIRAHFSEFEDKSEQRAIIHALNEISLRTDYTSVSFFPLPDRDNVLFVKNDKILRSLVISREMESLKLNLWVTEKFGMFTLEDWLANDKSKPLRVPNE